MARRDRFERVWSQRVKSDPSRRPIKASYRVEYVEVVKKKPDGRTYKKLVERLVPNN